MWGNGSLCKRLNMVFKLHTVLLGGASLLLLLTAACSKAGGEAAAPPPVSQPQEVALPSLTKTSAVLGGFDGSAASLKTFRAALLNADFPWQHYAAQGTYCNIYKHPAAGVSEKWYHPLRTDNTGAPLTDAGSAISSWAGSEGAWLANGSVPEFQKGSSGETWGDSKYGLWATPETAYRLLLVSPARSFTSFLGTDEDGNLLPESEVNYRYGFYQKRKDDPLFISPASPVQLHGTYLNHYGSSNEYVYKAQEADLTLTDHRSRLWVETYVDEALDQVHVHKIYLSNLITEAVYLPIDERTGNPRWIYDWDGVSHLFLNSEAARADEYGDDSNYALKTDVELHYKNASGVVNDPIPVIDDFYLLAQDYSELDRKGYAVHPIPTLNVELLSDRGDIMPVAIPLSWNFEPMHQYKLILRISTWYLYVYVKGSDWSDDTYAGQRDFEFGVRPDIQIKVRNPLVSGDPWDDGASHNGTI